MSRGVIPLPPNLGHEPPTYHLHNQPLPPYFQASNSDRTSAAQTPRDDSSSYFQGNGLGYGEALNFAPDVQPHEDNDKYYANPGTPLPPGQSEGIGKTNRGDLKKAPPGGQFPQKLSLMLKDQDMAKYIQIYGSNGFRIPNIMAFAENVLPKHFPDQNQWGSFQKQLSNYGYKKKDRDKNSGIWIQVRSTNPSAALRRSKCPPPRSTVQELRPATPAASSSIVQPQDQSDLYMRMIHLEDKLSATESELEATRGRLSEVEGQLKTMMNFVQEMSKTMATLFAGNTPSHPVAYCGPVAGPVDDGFPAKQVITSSVNHYEPTLKIPSNTHISRPSQNNSSHRGVETTTDTINPAFLSQQPPNLQHPSFGPLRTPAPTLPPAVGQHTSGKDSPQPILFCGWMENDTGPMDFDPFGQQQNVSPSTGAQNFASTSATAFEAQAPPPPRNPSSPRTLSKRAYHGGMEPVPPPPPPRGWFR
ncbi:hypothetical protein FS837_008039 [Tulasnella sp. UAMH 9824]|nr:hypothetical protein FS837_008039 [Tulasnella sp. UAMH 9824]